MDKKTEPIIQAEELVKNLRELTEEIESGLTRGNDITPQKTPNVQSSNSSFKKEGEKS